jgi:3-oxoacyl-[acyl-carrier-protein] synthase-3
MKRNVKIIGIGSYLPKRIVKAEEIDKMFSQSIGWSEKKSGVKQRYYVNGKPHHLWELKLLYKQFKKQAFL